jgi:hypothetical protein
MVYSQRTNSVHFVKKRTFSVLNFHLYLVFVFLCECAMYVVNLVTHVSLLICLIFVSAVTVLRCLPKRKLEQCINNISYIYRTSE